jgi:prophage maintenance system killer protein
MNPEYMLSKDDIKQINEKYGGTLRSDAEIETALFMGKGRSLYRKIAYLWRAVLVGRPFTDGNKRTALAFAEVLFESSGFKLNPDEEKRLIEAVIKISKDNLREINRIEGLIRHAVKKD